MTASTLTSACRSTASLAVLFASLALAPAALAASPLPPDRVDALGGANPASHVAVALSPDRADALGGSSPSVHVIRIAPPDRVDGLGGSHTTSVSAPSVVIHSSSGFDWTAAAIGAIAGLGISLLLMAAWVTRSRRDVALPS